MNILKIYWIFFNKSELSLYFPSFFAYFISSYPNLSQVEHRAPGSCCCSTTTCQADAFQISGSRRETRGGHNFLETCPTRILDQLGSALTCIRHEQTNRQAKYIYIFILIYIKLNLFNVYIISRVISEPIWSWVAWILRDLASTRLLPTDQLLT